MISINNLLINTKIENLFQKFDYEVKKVKEITISLEIIVLKKRS